MCSPIRLASLTYCRPFFVSVSVEIISYSRVPTGVESGTCHLYRGKWLADRQDVNAVGMHDAVDAVRAWLCLPLAVVAEGYYCFVTFHSD